MGLILLTLLFLPTSASASWRDCGTLFLQMSGRSTVSLSQIYSNSRGRGDEFMSYLMALIYVESGFSPLARSQAGAHGLTQVTDIAIQDAAEYCDLPRSTGDLYDIETNVKYGSCYLHRAFSQTGNWTRALVLYNGGYRQLTRYDRGDNIDSETANYVLKILRLQQLCR